MCIIMALGTLDRVTSPEEQISEPLEGFYELRIFLERSISLDLRRGSLIGLAMSYKSSSDEVKRIFLEIVYDNKVTREYLYDLMNQFLSTFSRRDTVIKNEWKEDYETIMDFIQDYEAQFTPNSRLN